MEQIQKLDIEIKQLSDALEEYFADRFDSAIVLARAAEQSLAA